MSLDNPLMPGQLVPTKDTFQDPGTSPTNQFIDPFAGINIPDPNANNKAYSDPVADVMQKFSDSGPSTAALSGPTNFDWDKNKTDRYANSPYLKELGFDPNADNETKYGQRQTWGNALSNAVVGGAKLAGQSFMQGWEGWGNLANALFNWDSNKTFSERLMGTPDELMAQDKSQEDVMNKYAIFQTPDEADSVFNKHFIGNMLQQGGFVVGALGQTLAENFLTAGVASGLEGVDLGLAMTKMTGKAVDAAEVLKDAVETGQKIYKDPSIVEGLLNSAKKLIPLSDTISAVNDARKEGAGVLQMAYIGAGGIKRALSEANMAFTQGRMLASGTYGDLYSKLTQEYVDRHGQQPVGDDLEKICSTAEAAATGDFYANSGIQLITNRVQFGNLFDKFGYERQAAKDALDMENKNLMKVTGNLVTDNDGSVLPKNTPVTQVYEKGALGAVGQFGNIAADFGKTRAAWEIAKDVAGKGMMKWETTGGLHMLLQDATNQSLQDYYYDLYHHDLDPTKKDPSFLNSAWESAKKEFSEQGLQSFLLGAGTGLLLSPLTGGVEHLADRISGRLSFDGKGADGQPASYRQYLDQQKALKSKDLADLNTFFRNPKNALHDEIAGFNVQSEAAGKMAAGAKAQDMYVYNNAKDSALANTVAIAKRTNMFDAMISTIKSYGDVFQDPKDFKDAWGIDAKDSGIANPRTYFDTIASKIQDHGKLYDRLMDQYGDLVNPSLYKKDSDGERDAQLAQIALHHSIEMLATNRYKGEQAVVRMADVYSKLAENKTIGGSSQKAVRIMGSEVHTDNEIGTLKGEIASMKLNPSPDKQAREDVMHKESQLDALQRWKDSYKEYMAQPVDERRDNEKASNAYSDYLKAMNEADGLSTKVNIDDIKSAFGTLTDHIQLNHDNQDYVDAYNLLAHPKNFMDMHSRSVDALKKAIEQIKEERQAELTKNNQEDTVKQSFTLNTTDEKGETHDTEIREGDHYITKADPDNVIFKGKVAKTYNNNLLHIQQIDGDKVTVKVNNDKTYTVNKDQLSKAGRLWNLSDMTPDERIYFKNRDQLIQMKVNAKTGKPHLINGEHADKDYSGNSVKVNARLVLEKGEEGKNELKLQYKDPVSGKLREINYNQEYMKKYGVGKFDLRGLPSEVEEQHHGQQERLERNYQKQLDVFNSKFEDTSARLEETQKNREANQKTFEDLRQQLMDNRTHLELVSDELAKFDGKMGRKSNFRKELEKTRDNLTQSISDAQAHIDEVKKERSSLDEMITSLKAAKALYEEAAVELEVNKTPFDRNGGKDLSSNLQDEKNNLDKNQVTRRYSAEEVNGMIADTQREVAELADRIPKLEGYVKDVKDILSRITMLKDFMDFMDLPENTTKRSSLRDFLRTKIDAEQDPDKKADYQKLMNQVLRGGKDAENILFFTSSLRDSLKELDQAQAKLQESSEKLARLQQASDEKQQLSTMQDRINFLNQVQDALVKNYQVESPAKTPVTPVTPVKADTTTKEMASDIAIETDTEAPTYIDRKPRFEEVGFNKTFGRHYLDDEDTKLNTEHGSDRFFSFTGKQNVMGQGYQMQVVTEHNDEFGIRQPDINPNDIKLVLVKPTGNSYAYIDKDGKVIEEPTKDNIIYRSMADVNNLTVDRVRRDYTVHESTKDEDILKKINEHKAYQAALVQRTEEGPVYLNAINTSPGKRRIERLHETDENGQHKIAKAEVEGRVIEDNPSWDDLRSAANPEAHIALRVETAKEGGSIAPGIQPGRAVMQEFTFDEAGKKLWGDKVTRVFNRELTDEEKNTVTEALVRLSKLFGRKNTTSDQLKLSDSESAELQLIQDYLQNVLCWGDGFGDKSFFISNGLNRGDMKVPFNEAAIRSNADELLKDTYHHINSRTLRKNDEFNTIRFEDGKAVPTKSFETYEQYLLEKREDGIPPVYTSLPRHDSETPQRTNAYINWADPSVQVEKPGPNKYIAGPETKSTTVNDPAKDINDFINYDKKGITVNGVTFVYKSDGDGVYMEARKGDRTRRSPSFASKEDLIANKDTIQNAIYEASGYNPSLNGLRSLRSQLQSKPADLDGNEPAPAITSTTANEQSTLSNDTKPATGAGQGETGNEKKTSDPLAAIKALGQPKPLEKESTGLAALKALGKSIEAPKIEIPSIQPEPDEDGKMQYFDIPSAVNGAAPKNGFLTATVHEKNAYSGETRVSYEATVKIPDGKLSAAKALLTNELNKQLQSESEEETPYRMSMDKVEALEDFKALKTFMDANLPQIPVKKVGELIHGKAWGSFMKGAMYIYDKAELGTGYHEAFEAVWKSYLPDDEQQGLIDEFRQRKGEFTNPFSKETKAYADASDFDARELMAEEFRKYILNNEPAPAKKAQGFFSKVWDFIKKIFGMNKDQQTEMNGKINNLFQKIGTGDFRKLEPIRELNTELPEYRAVGGLTQEETAHAVEGLNYYFFTELYKDGGNIDTLLNKLDPKLSNEKLNEIFDKAHSQVLDNTRILGERVNQELVNNKQGLYDEFKNSVSRYGLDFDEQDNMLVKEEQTNNALGIRDSISVNPTKMSAINTKLLISSLPDTKVNSTGKYIVKRNGLNQPKLVDYDRTHMLLLNELSNVVSHFDEKGNQKGALDLMFGKLDGKYQLPSKFYRDGYGWMRSLKLRLRYEDAAGAKVPPEALSADDMMMRIGFTKSFTNARSTPQKTMMGEDGYIYSLNPMDLVNSDRVRTNWSNALKDAINNNTNDLVKIEPSGKMVVNRTGETYKNIMSHLNELSKFDMDRTLDTLSKFGITFSAGKRELNKYEGTLRENTVQILNELKAGTINDVADIFGSNKIDGRIDTMLGIESGFTGEDTMLSYRNADGEQQYAVGIPSLLSNTINTLNSVGSLKEMVQSAPWLGTIGKNGEVMFNGYQSNSELLRKGGILFDKNGNRRPGAKIGFQIISGMGTSDFEGTATDELQFPERVANKIHYLLNNTVFSNINSDKSTEFGIGMPGKPLVSVNDVQKLFHFGSSDIANLYMGHLTDEMQAAVANKINPSNVQYYRDQVSSLGHFRDVLGKELVNKFKNEVIGDKAKYTGDNAHLDFIRNNRKILTDKINSYLNDQADKTVQFLKDLDIFTKPGVPGNDLYITNAVDNDRLNDLLKIANKQSVVTGVDEDGDKQERKGYTENDLHTLAGYLAFNEEALITEQHKLIYGHPAFYKDLPKRANGATSTKEQMVDDPDVIKWMDNHMGRNDGKIRSSDSHQTIKVISFADNNVITPVYKDIAEGMYRDMVKTEGDKKALEKKIGATFDKDGQLTGFTGDKNGLVKDYLKLNEADAMAWGMPDAIRDMLFLTSKLTKEQMKQFDYETAYEKLVFHDRGIQKLSDEELNGALATVKAGDPGEIFPVLKPQYFGYAEDPGIMHPVFLKHAVQPKFFRHVEGTQFEKLYLAARKNQVDLIGFESGEKVGNVVNKNGGFTSIYNDKGEVNVTEGKKGFDLPKDLPQQKLYSRFYGIQVEMSPKSKDTVVRGTQVSKLIMVNYFHNGEPINEKVGQLVQEYNDTMTNMIRLGKENLLKELGLAREDGNYKTSDLTSLVKTLRKEAMSRDLPDNMINGIDAMLNEDNTHSLKYKFDTLINREKIDNILNSMVDSRVISEKINGKAAVQVASTLYESEPRKFMYMKDGVYTQLDKKSLKGLTTDEKNSIRMTSSDLKFYRNENGKISKMEVYVTWPYKNFTPEEMGLKLVNGIYKLDGTHHIDGNLLNSIGFRIPTQGMNSIDNIRIKGFTPVNNGDMIVVPSEIVGKAGSDFDIDKLNMYMANHFYNSRTGQLQHIEWKGSLDKTREHYNDLYDRGELLSKQQGTALERYISQEKDFATSDKAEDKLLRSIFGGLFSEEDMTKEFMNSLSNPEERKEKIVNELVKKGLQNHFIDTMGSLIEQPSNYRQLVTPNSVANLKALADEINGYKQEAGTKSREDEKSYNYLRTFIGSNSIRERYLTAKRMVGIAALHSTLHSLAQVAGLKLEGEFKVPYYLGAPQEKLRRMDIKLPHNPAEENGQYNIGHRYDTQGNLISDTNSEKLSGFVDGAKDPFVFDLNLNMNTSGTWFYLNHLGVPEKDIAYLFNQPVMDKYFDEYAKNQSGFKKINGDNLNAEKLFYKVSGDYFKDITGRDINQEIADRERFPKAVRSLKRSYMEDLNTIAQGFEQFTPKQMIDAIKVGKDADPKLQIAALMNYLEYNAQGRQLSTFMQGIGYDNKKTKTVQENMLQQVRWEKAKAEKFVANPDDLLDKTFLGEMKNQKEDIFNMFKDFFVTLSPKVQSVFRPMEEKLSNPDLFMTQDNQTQMLNRYQNFAIGYLLHTTEFGNDTDGNISLNQLYDHFFQGKDSMAKLLQRYKKSSDPNIADNLVIKELLPLMNDDINKTDNISLFRNKIDTFKVNELTEALDNLKSYGDQTADSQLSDFVDNLAKFNIMQNGVQASATDFRKIMSTGVYSELVKQILDSAENQPELDPAHVWKSFHQNNWSNQSIVPKAPKWLKVTGNKLYVNDGSSVAANDYIIKYTRKPGLKVSDVNEMRKNKTLSNAFLPVLFEKQYLMDNGKWVYEPVNRYGNGQRMLEIYKDERPSILPQNGDISKDFTAKPGNDKSSGWLSYTDLMNKNPEVGTPGQPDDYQGPTNLPSGAEVETALDRLDAGCKA